MAQVKLNVKYFLVLVCAVHTLLLGCATTEELFAEYGADFCSPNALDANARVDSSADVNRNLLAAEPDVAAAKSTDDLVKPSLELPVISQPELDVSRQAESSLTKAAQELPVVWVDLVQYSESVEFTLSRKVDNRKAGKEAHELGCLATNGKVD